MLTLSTGEIAQLFQISKYKIRHYIDEGILVPKRNPENGYYILKKPTFTVYIKLSFLEKLAFLFKKSKKVCLVKK